MRVRNRMLLVVRLSAVTMAILAANGSASASEDTDAARALFTEARRLAADGEYGRACPLFEKSLKLEAGIGTEYNLADCWEHTGRMASAYEMFRKVASASRNNAQADRERVATQRADAIASKLSRLQVKIDSTVKTLRVSHNGVTLEERAWSEPTPVDPGAYRVASVSGDKEIWAADVTVPEQGFTVVVAVPRPGAKPVIVTEKPATKPQRQFLGARKDGDSESAVPMLRPSAPEPRSKGSVWPTLGLLAGGAGLAFGTLFAIVYESKNGEARDICPGSAECTDSEIQRHTSVVNDAKAARLGAALSFGIGAASLAAVSAYYIWKPSNREKEPNVAWQLAPSVGAGNGGFWGAAAQGSW